MGHAPRQRIRSDPDSLRALHTGRERVRARGLTTLYGRSGDRVITFPVVGRTGAYVRYGLPGGRYGLVLLGPLLRDGRAVAQGCPTSAADYELFASEALAREAAGQIGDQDG